MPGNTGGYKIKQGFTDGMEEKMAEKVRDYGKLARDIIREAGGKENIVNATRCATRLRLVLNKTPETAMEKISSMPGVITVVETGKEQMNQR